MKKILALSLVVIIFACNCSGMTPTEQRVLSGGAIGAASGAAIGAISGSAATGAAIGGGAGVVGGLLYDLYRRNRGY